MKKSRLRVRGGFRLIIWSMILLSAVFLLIRFAVLSFSADVGQAKGSIKDSILADLSIRVVESGSSFIKYTAKGEGEEDDYSFPMNLVANKFKLSEYMEDNSLQTVMAKESSSSSNIDNPFHIDNYGANEVIGSDQMEEVETGNNLDQDENIVVDTDTNQNSNSIGYYKTTEGVLTKEYILSNGAYHTSSDWEDMLLANSSSDGNISDDTLDHLKIGIEKGDIDSLKIEDDTKSVSDNSVETMQTNSGVEYTLDMLKDTGFLVRNFYIVDEATKVTDKLFDADKLLGEDMKIKQGNELPQILIYHTHSQEAYIDSRENNEADSVVGVGTYLTNILRDQYGYNVIHDTSCYDIVDGVLDRNVAYNMAEEGIVKILKDNPSIEVVIDLHRDGAPARVTTIDGKETAQIMLFNGLSRNETGPITYLDNPYLQDNLAFSLQLQLKSLALESGLFYKNYLHCYRYNLHVRPKSILMELGTNFNTVQSAKNAMAPFAQVLDAVLQGE